MDKDVLADRFSGCLLGMAMGDALGSPADGLSPFLAIKRFQHLDGFFRGGRYGFATSLALNLAGAVVAEGGLSRSAVIKAHLAILPKLPPPWTNVVSQLSSGKQLEECGCADSMDAWSALKMVPVGLWGALRGMDDADLLRACRLACNRCPQAAPCIWPATPAPRIWGPRQRRC